MTTQASHDRGVGALVERVQLQSNTPPTIDVASLVRATASATVTTSAAHGYTTGDYVTIAGATPTGYNGKFKITVTGPTTFTYTCNSTLATPATGPITSTYVSDAQGGQRLGWVNVGPSCAAALIPLRAFEAVQNAALQSETVLRFRVRRRLDVTTSMRLVWRPMWPTGAPTLTLAISAITPEGDGRSFMWIDTKGA